MNFGIFSNNDRRVMKNEILNMKRILLDIEKNILFDIGDKNELYKLLYNLIVLIFESSYRFFQHLKCALIGKYLLVNSLSADELRDLSKNKLNEIKHSYSYINELSEEQFINEMEHNSAHLKNLIHLTLNKKENYEYKFKFIKTVEHIQHNC